MIQDREILCTEGLLESGVVDFVYGLGWRSPTVESLRNAQHGTDRSPGLELPKRAVIACFSVHLNDVLSALPFDGRYVLISRDADPGFTRVDLPECVHHLFSISVKHAHPRVTAIPAGLQAFWPPPRHAPPRSRGNRVLVAYSLDDPHSVHDPAYDTRFSAIEYFRDKSWATVNTNLLGWATRTGPLYPSWGSEEYIGKLRAHDFLITPVGYGVERAAGWEAMANGTIPIMIKRAEFDYFDDMPIAFVNSWSEATPEWLDVNENLFQRKSDERLRLAYWVDRIREKRNEVYE